MASAGQSTEQARPGQDIDAIPTLAWSARPDGSAELLNRRWLDYTGLSAEEASDRGWTVALHTEDRDRFVEFWRHLLDSGEGAEIDARLRRYDGEYRWFLFRAEPVRDNHGGILKRYGANTDIEDRKRAEALLAATNKDLRAAMADGTFRQDLFYRLNVFPIQVPVLLDRVDDIPLLVEYLVDRYAKKAGKRIRSVSKNTLNFFQGYDWPGNILV